MRNSIKIIFASLSILLLTSFVKVKPHLASHQYKCMVQLMNYTGEGAYIVVSIIDKEGSYVKTLQVLGDDEEWYPELPKWWSFYESKNKPDIDGITGATIAGGERSMFLLEIDESYLDNGGTSRTRFLAYSQWTRGRVLGWRLARGRRHPPDWVSSIFW